MKATADRHVPVLVQRCTELLGNAGNGLVVDATLGMGGHSEALLRAYPGAFCVESFHPLIVAWFRRHAPAPAARPHGSAPNAAGRAQKR